MIGIHIDLKYQMPDKQYLHHWLKEIAGLGIDTLLLEYEDKFPFKKYPFLRNAEAFTDDELKAFLATARGAGLRVIPLVQSFSHLEFALAQNVDYVALSFVREAEDVLDLTRRIPRDGPPVVVKIEKGLALENLQAIMDVSAAVMVDRKSVV